jgi:ABC-type transporter Mla subunit MlaD
MQINRNEISTGILVILTLGLFILFLVLLGMPGVIRPLNTYRIYFDNASGIHPGAPVLLAGREIGKVISLQSPVELQKRPKGHPDFEVSIDVEVDRTAKIYYDTTVNLLQQGFMGQEVIDFVHGDAVTGLAENHTEFVGERIPDVTEVMSRDMNSLVEPNSNLSIAIKNAKTFMETLNGAHISELINNTEQFTDILKREPWRLVWPGGKNTDDTKSNHDQNKEHHPH